MRVFVTGATGFIGSAIVPELIGAGHQVVGLARSDAAAAALAKAGAEAHRGSLEDLDSLRRGAESSDGVIHAAFIHDFSRMDGVGQIDLRAVETLGSALEGSNRPLVVTSGTMLVAARPATEVDTSGPDSLVTHRVASEHATLALAARGVRSSLLRLPPSVHGRGDHGFVIGRHLDLPVVSLSPAEAAAHFDWMAGFFGLDVHASSALTRARMGWDPTHPGLIADVDEGHHFRTAQAA